MSSEYDISKAFRKIEEEIIMSMKRNLSRHIKEEQEEGFSWSMWQAEQLNSLKEFRKNNPKLFKKYFSTIDDDIEELLKKTYEDEQAKQETKLLEAFKNDKSLKTNSSFFKINYRKLNALIKEAQEGTQKAESSILRYTNDQYRKIIFNAQVYANTGAGTIKKAIDMATRDFLSAGINSIQYSNGNRVNIESYVSMVMRTSNKRAQMYGEGEKRGEWGIHTVLVHNRGGGCPFCSKYQGKVFIDDVYSSGTTKESKSSGYPLLSTAMAGGLFHPNCKDRMTTYFPGINSEPKPPTKEEIEIKRQNYIKDQKLKYINRNIEKFKRLELGSLDEENVQKYHNKRLEWQEYKKRFKENNNLLFNDINSIDKSLKDDIIIKKLSKEEQKLQYIGKLDKNKLGEYKKKIITDKVIITNERIEHTQKRHPGDYEKYINYIPDIIKNPDYILEDKDNEDTILMLKTIQEKQKNIQVVVKLLTNINEKEKSNSILTFWHIRSRNYKSTIKNNKIIYNKLDKIE